VLTDDVALYDTDLTLVVMPSIILEMKFGGGGYHLRFIEEFFVIPDYSSLFLYRK
jgi:hypothetical protein